MHKYLKIVVFLPIYNGEKKPQFSNIYAFLRVPFLTYFLKMKFECHRIGRKYIISSKDLIFLALLFFYSRGDVLT